MQERSSSKADQLSVTIEDNRRVGAINFVTDAFNGKVDSIMSKVKHDNYGKPRKQSTTHTFRPTSAAVLFAI
ncbi:MAG: DUF4041 domain-containing protein [Phycisphaerales bacterium]